jgi:hypothetical protein
MIMLKNRTMYQILSALVMLSVLAGCSFIGGSPAAAPTQDPSLLQATLDQAKTQAIETMVADLTKNAPAATNTPAATETSAPTNTLAPTSTEIPTATMAPSFTPAPTQVIIVNTNTPAATSTPKTVTCTLSEIVPATGEDFKPNAPFDAAWTIKNTGSSTWSANAIDINYLSGQKMHEGADMRDLPGDVAAAGTFRYIFDMKAPANAGRYTETWAITQSGVNLCILSVTIDVVP